MIAALFVQAGGAYFGLEGVDPWHEVRDARWYSGPWPVVAHPPCARWCALAGLVQKRYGHKIGDDGGAFASALDSVRRFGGVLEHPAYSKAWAHHGLERPHHAGGWTELDAFSGRSCHVEQGNYGHPARKATWIYAVGAPAFELRWGKAVASAWVGYAGNHNRKRASGRPSATSRGEIEDRPRLTKKQGAATPPDFRAMLLSLARSVIVR